MSKRPSTYASLKERMNLVLELARANVENGTGGPFAAAVFTMSDATLVSVGLNLVVSSKCSVLHAETVAIMLAQKKAGHHDLGGKGIPAHELVSTTEPCAMCLGAISWSGIRRLACGAREEDAKAIGFDEGPKPSAWPAALAKRGITVVRDVLRPAAAKDLLRYQQRGGLIYNGRRGI